MTAPDLPKLADMPIPEDVQPGKGWTDQMLELAELIGPYATMLIVDRHGGEAMYIAANPEKNKLRDLVGPAKAAVLSREYRTTYLQIPTAKYALRHARRQGILAAVRARTLTGADAARILRTSKSYLSHLVNATDEGIGAAPIARYRKPDTRQMDMFGEE